MTTWALFWGRCEVGEETHQVPVNAVGSVNSLNKSWKCTKPSALLLSPWLSNIDLFLSTLQKSCIFNLVFSVCLMMLQLERLRWDSMWDCVWKIRQDPICWVGPSAWAGWAALHKLLQVKKHILHLCDNVGTGGEMRMERLSQGWQRNKHQFWTPLDFWANHSLYKSLKPG